MKESPGCFDYLIKKGKVDDYNFEDENGQTLLSIVL